MACPVMSGGAMNADPIFLRAPDAQAHGGKNAWVNKIASLDPIADHQEIVRITGLYEFPWDYVRSLEFALFRTYCVPSISKLLQETGEFEFRSQKRYDDTALLMVEMLENGYDSQRGVEALRTINRQHHKYTISNDDMLYTLSTFTYDPLDWIDRFGWRRLHPNERIAAFEYYKNVGQRMGIKNIPATSSDFHAFKLRYEREMFGATDDVRKIGEYSVKLMQAWYPKPVAPLVRRAIYDLLDPGMSRAFGYPPANPRRQAQLHKALRARSWFVGKLPMRRHVSAINSQKPRSYPTYDVTKIRPSALGPDAAAVAAAHAAAGVTVGIAPHPIPAPAH